MNTNRLPADSTATTLGIVSLSLIIVGFCCGFFSIVALVLGIIGLVKANNSIKLYYKNPSEYSELSYKNVNTGRILNIIAIPISSIFSLIWIAYYAFYGAIMLSAFSGIAEAAKEAKKIDNELNSRVYNENYHNDESVIEIEKDTIFMDSTNVQSLDFSK